jgi:uncharacterized protein
MNLRYLILHLTLRCNLRCVYCYHGDRPHPPDMSESVLDRALELAAAGRGPFHLQLTGGEPSLVPALIARAARRARALARPCTIAIQTNGTGIDSELIRLIRKYDITVGVSLDGPPAIHEALRGQAARTLGGLQRLEAERVPFGVTTVVTRDNAGVLDQLVWLLAGFGMARGIGLDLLVHKGRAAPVSPVAPADGAALAGGVAAMLAAVRAVNRLRPTPLTLREQVLLDKARSGGGEFCHAGRGQSAAVHPDGRLYPCGQTLADRRFAAGSVWRPDAEALQAPAFIRQRPQACSDCPLQGRCPGDCPSRRHYNRTAVPEPACNLYRALWNAGRGRI